LSESLEQTGVTDACALPAWDPRVARSRAVVLAACAELLSEVGFGGVTIEAVAARSGVAKTTIYRQWSSRAELMIDAFRTMATPPVAPDTGDVARDLEHMMLKLARDLVNEPWSRAIPSLADAAARDPELARLHAQFSHECRTPVVAVVARAQDRGELDPDVAPDVVCAALAGPLFFRHMVSREPVDAAFVSALLASVLNGIRAPRHAPEPRT
jgi:AcrR family transcriptional regulator